MGAVPELKPEMLDDIEVLELLSEIDKGALVKVPELFRRVFGDDGYEAVKAHLSEDGRTKASDMIAWFVGQAAAKN